MILLKEVINSKTREKPIQIQAQAAVDILRGSRVPLGFAGPSEQSSEKTWCLLKVAQWCSVSFDVIISTALLCIPLHPAPCWLFSEPEKLQNGGGAPGWLSWLSV